MLHFLMVFGFAGLETQMISYGDIADFCKKTIEISSADVTFGFGSVLAIILESGIIQSMKKYPTGLSKLVNQMLVKLDRNKQARLRGRYELSFYF